MCLPRTICCCDGISAADTASSQDTAHGGEGRRNCESFPPGTERSATVCSVLCFYFPLCSVSPRRVW
uniref:Uncharacterized protein n=1 Tax=Anopheles dirus TaxID=7168 RepID=A0A182NWJ4_9DIPT